MPKRHQYHPVFFFFDTEVWLKPANTPCGPGEGPIAVEHMPVHPLPRCEQPTGPCEVPIPLQHNIRYAYESGVKQEHLAMIYGYPLAWIALFCVTLASDEVPN